MRSDFLYRYQDLLRNENRSIRGDIIDIFERLIVNLIEVLANASVYSRMFLAVTAPRSFLLPT